jgi:hypothetical protein
MGTSFGLRNKPIPKRCPTTWNYPKKLSSGCLYSCCLMSFPRSQEHGSRARYAWDGLCTCEHGGGTWIHKKRYMAGTEHLLVICTWVILYPYIHIYIYTFTHLYFYCCTAGWRYQQVLTQPGVWTRSCSCLSFFMGIEASFIGAITWYNCWPSNMWGENGCRMFGWWLGVMLLCCYTGQYWRLT